MVEVYYNKVNRGGNPRRLHGPGPSPVERRVLEAMASPTLGHLDPDFLEIMNETQDRLRELYRTKDAFTLPVSGTGSAGMETLVANFVEPQDNVLVVVNGVFGGRIKDCVSRYGGNASSIDIDWGTVVTPETMRDALDQGKFASVFLVNAETSTGALQQNMPELSDLVHKHGALFLVDAVTSLGGAEFNLDGWDIDAAYSGTQKCIGAPTGLSPVAVRQRALGKLDRRKNPVQSWYFDLGMIRKYWNDGTATRAYHHTAPINNIFGLHQALEIISEEGIVPRIERHRDNALALQEGLQSLGFKYIVEDPQQRLPMLHAVYVPQGVDESQLRSALLKDHNLEIGGALGKFAGKAVRIGLMGHGSRPGNVEYVLHSIGQVIGK